MIANALHHHQLLSAAKRPILLTMRNDAACQHIPYARQLFKFSGWRRVDVDSRGIGAVCFGNCRGLLVLSSWRMPREFRTRADERQQQKGDP